MDGELMRATNVKPFTYWLIHSGYTVRFSHRTPESVRGVITTPEGEKQFDYDPADLTIRLPDRTVAINQFGWETKPTKSNADESTRPND